MIIRDCLRRAPETVPPQCTCREAAALMDESGVGALLVVEAGVLVGIITDRDIVTRAIAQDRPTDTPVAVVMTPGPVTVEGRTELEEAVKLFGTGQFRRLPVLEEGELAGIVTVDDVLVGSLFQLGAALRPIARDVAWKQPSVRA